MPWSAPISTGDVVAIHTALVPTANGDGEILLFGGDNHVKTNNETNQVDHARRFNCRNPLQALQYVHSPAFDVFCCGHAALGDGRVLVAGGTDQFTDDVVAGPHAHLHFTGHRHSTIYDPATGMFGVAADMRTEPGQPGGGGRWYPTLCTISTGEVLAVSGHPEHDDTRHSNNTPERYQPLFDHWVGLPAVGASSGNGTPNLYPRLHLLPNETIFVSSAMPGFSQNIAFNPWSGATRQVCNLPDGVYQSYAHSSVMLPLVPGDGYRARIMLCGGATSRFLDLDAANPAWTAIPRNGSTATQDRANCMATLLPTGDVLLTGGAVPGNDQAGILKPEIYRTPLDPNTHLYQSGVGHWDTLEDPGTLLRNYHSAALLLPDGRVWTAGGNGPAQPGGQPTDAQKKIEIFDPPYPAGPRPVINACPSFLAYGDTFEIGVAQAEQIGTVVLMRCGSATHAFNPDQRAVVLAFQTHGGSALSATCPPTGAIAPPGNYMLFVIDRQRRPCQYARFVRVGGSMSMFTNRNNFSQQEVEALLSGADGGRVPNAFYVVLDGFCLNDLSGAGGRPFPPTVRFNFNDNSVVHGLSAEMVDVLPESMAAPPNVTQRITLSYRLVFANTDAFSGIATGDEKGIRISVAWGPTHTTGQMSVFLHEHVYALDGPTPWLSIDVRVASVPRGGFLGGRQNNGPVPLIQELVEHFRQTTSDEFHPFMQLTPNQDASRLELSPTVNGTLVDNFAFAKVRFRAPAGVLADDVKMFFRLFTTAVTDMAYNSSTIYRRNGNGANAVPLQGMVGGEVASIPFFASNRNPDPQMQQDPTNVTPLHGAGANEVVSYFGCWLDFNHNVAIRNQIRGRHQCMVAEIHYPTSPIPAGANPANSDELSQRNLAIVESDNPGGAAAHTVVHTFEVKPSPAGAAPGVNGAKERFSGPDELFIRWNGLPRDSVATIYLPGVQFAQFLSTAASRAGSDSLAIVNDDTVRCRVGGATYLPLPHGTTTNLAGLIAIELPPTVRTGQTYTVSVHQVSGVARRIIDSFELAILVSRSELLVEAARRDLAVLREIGATIPVGDRWHPVFNRYLELLTDRVRGFGGDPDTNPETEDATSSKAGGKTLRGKIVTIDYDCFGDFAGFVLDACCGGQRRFRAREHHLFDVVREASINRRTVAVSLCEHDRERAASVSIEYL